MYEVNFSDGKKRKKGKITRKVYLQLFFQSRNLLFHFAQLGNFRGHHFDRFLLVAHFLAVTVNNAQQTVEDEIPGLLIQRYTLILPFFYEIRVYAVIIRDGSRGRGRGRIALLTSDVLAHASGLVDAKVRGILDVLCLYRAVGTGFEVELLANRKLDEGGEEACRCGRAFVKLAQKQAILKNVANNKLDQLDKI